MSTYLVTGVAGFIGSSIARELLRRGEHVRGVDNFSTGLRQNLADMPALEFLEGDIRDPGMCQQICSGTDFIFHEAALASVPRSVTDPVSSNEVNVTGTMNLLVAARDAKVKRVIFAGSSSAYGNTPTLPKREDMPLHPISPYAVSKVAGEHYMESFWHVYGLETVVLRYFNVFGPYQDPTSQYSGVLARFTEFMHLGKQPTIFGDGEQSRDFTYIDNVVHGNLLACAAPAAKVAGKVFNVATGTALTLNEVYKILSSLTGYSNPPKYGPMRAGDVQNSLADIHLAREAFGYEPIVDTPTGFARTVEFYRRKSAASSPAAKN